MKAKTILKNTAIGLVTVSFLVTLTATEPYKEDKAQFYKLMSQVSNITREYSNSLDAYEEINQNYISLQKDYAIILQDNIGIVKKANDYRDYIESLEASLDFAIIEKNALQNENYNFSISLEDRLLLSKILFTEAQSESLEGKLAVLQVIYNRINSSEFPNSVYEVIVEKEQFSGYRTENFGRTSIETDYAVFAYADLNLRARNISEDVTYFYSSHATSSFLKSLKVVQVIENHSFCVD